MPPTQETYEAIRLAATRIAAYAESIQQAHAFGHGPGPIHEIWGREYQEKAMQVYTKTIPWDYLVNLARQFKNISRDMTVAPTPANITNEWFIVTEYLRNAAEVILSFAPPTAPTAKHPLATATPSVMEFGLLAEIASAAGAEELRNASLSIRQAMHEQATTATANPLSPNQTQILHLLATGHTILEIGETLGYSIRTIQRKLTEIQVQLQVGTRHEAITAATTNNWLNPTQPPGPSTRPPADR